jgi:hypothetical protein
MIPEFDGLVGCSFCKSFHLPIDGTYREIEWKEKVRYYDDDLLDEEGG